MRPNSSANRQSNSKSANAMPRPIMPSAPPRHQPRRAAFGRDRSRRSLRKYNGGLNVAPPPHGSCFLLFSVWCCFWCFRLSLLRVRRPWPGPCTRAGAGAGPQAAARTTPPPHFKGKTMKNCLPGVEQRGSPMVRRVTVPAGCHTPRPAKSCALWACPKRKALGRIPARAQKKGGRNQ